MFKGVKQASQDPLMKLFEKHFQDSLKEVSDIEAWVSGVVQDYFEELFKLKIYIPEKFKKAVAEELSRQVYQMLFKKTYGSIPLQNMQHFRKN